MGAVKKLLTDHQSKFLKSSGWEFMPTGPDEWTWLKFDKTGNCIGQAGDELWTRDLTRYDEASTVIHPTTTLIRPLSLSVLDDQHFVGLWTYRPAGRAREFSASVMIRGQVQETEMHTTWQDALDEAAKLLRNVS